MSSQCWSDTSLKPDQASGYWSSSHDRSGHVSVHCLASLNLPTRTVFTWQTHSYRYRENKRSRSEINKHWHLAYYLGHIYLYRPVATCTQSTQLCTHCQRRGHFNMFKSAIKTWLMTLVDLQQVKSNETKLIDFISDDGCDCSSSWLYSVNAGEQHRTLSEVDSFKRRSKRV